MKTDTERLQYLTEYVEGVEPVQIVLGRTWDEPHRPDWEIWAEERTLLMGNGPTLHQPNAIPAEANDATP